MKGDEAMASTRLSSEPFSSVDAAWLHMDEPTNMAMVTGVLTFDAPLDLERFKAILTNRLLPIKRFRQRVKEPSLPLGLPRWEPDPHFDLNAHLHRIALPAPGGEVALQELASDMMSTSLDFTKPLWQMHLVENYTSGSALIVRLHHCMADGLTLVRVLLSIADKEPDAPWPEPPKEPPRLPWLAELFRPAVTTASSVLRATDALHEGMETLIHPSRLADAAKLGIGGAKALGKLLLILPDRKTVFKGSCGVAKRATWSLPIPVDDVKAVRRSMGGTVNDILLAAVTGALRRYMERRGEPTDGVNLHAVVPVSLRPLKDTDLNTLGNRFGLVFLSLPVGVREPTTRIRVLKQRMDAIKGSPEAVVTFGILSAMGMTPVQIENIIVSIFGGKATSVMTNVPGPRETLYLAGRPIRGIMFWVPQPGRLGLGVSIISYAGQVALGVATDAGLVPDPETIIAGFHAEFEQMKRVALPGERKSLRLAKDGRCQAMTQSGQRCKNRARPGSTTCGVHQR
jgi:diacylglycerol O-acyltransferase